MDNKKYIYVLGNEDSFKIGVSTNPNIRIKQLQTGCSSPLTVLWTMERADAYKLEKHLHRKFQKHKRVGEWFDKSKITLDQIKSESYMYTEYDW